MSPGRTWGFVVVVQAAECLILLDQHLLLTQGLTSRCVRSRFNISQHFLICAACATRCRYTSFCPEISNKTPRLLPTWRMPSIWQIQGPDLWSGASSLPPQGQLSMLQLSLTLCCNNHPLCTHGSRLHFAI